ncbi:fructose-bisphosphate aldolase class I [Candidatus Saccharibacteria bacterium]|nr:fructose-bisphosphate aldolase class I [Candidatus Saccharibacteria bacterium]
MSNVLIIGNVHQDVYLRLDEQKNQFETGEGGIPWLDLSFDGSSHPYIKETRVYAGATVALEVLSRMGANAKIMGSLAEFKGGEIVPGEQEIKTTRYILSKENKISYLVPSTRETTPWVNPVDPVDWIFVDRSAKITSDFIKGLKGFLSMSSHTRLVVYAPKNMTEADRELVEMANLVFSDGLLTGTKYYGSVCQLSDHEIVFGDYKIIWSAENADLMTHLTLYSILAATIFGALLRGKTIEDSIMMGRDNALSSTLKGTVPLERLEEMLSVARSEEADTAMIAKTLMTPGKGILAADESGGSIHKKFENMRIPDDEEHRRDYRNIFFTTPDLEKYVSGVILFDETARQKADDGRDFVSYLTSKGIVAGIKVDQGLENFENSEEKYTKGLEDLPRRLAEYYKMGLRFCKWRSAFEIGPGRPSDMAIEKNCQDLAKYARACQDAKMVPIVEPEVVYDGNYTIKQCADVTSKILDTLFDALNREKVRLDQCILKVNMVLAGKQYPIPSSKEEVGRATAEVLRVHVPQSLAGVVFLSGGQTVVQATENLQEVTNNGPFPWPVTFSFARALQDPALTAWMGNNENADTAREAFRQRLIANADALHKK